MPSSSIKSATKNKNTAKDTTLLDKLKKQRAVIEARIQKAESRNKHAQRKQDTRRKILIGSYYLEQAVKNNQLDNIKNLMNGFLKRDSDRKLFDLPLK
jgi:large subunit ribosomal protein L7/L12